MNIDTLEQCPTCNGTGKISPSILLVEEIESRLTSIITSSTGAIQIKVHPFVASFIKKGLFSQRFKWVMKFKRSIKIKESMSMHLTGYRFYGTDNKEIKY